MHLFAGADYLDLAILAVVVLYAVRGFRRGLVVGLASLVGFIGGGYLGAHLLTPLTQKVSNPTTATILGLGAVIACAVLGETLLSSVAAWLRRHLPLGPLRVVDALAGAALSIAGVLAVAWILGLAIVHSPFRTLATQVRDSKILTTVDHAVPVSASAQFSALLRTVEQTDLPPLFGGLGQAPIIPVAPPPATAVARGVVERIEASVVKVSTDDAGCNRATEGSGVVVAPGVVLTNAHVVAGSTSATITMQGPEQRHLPATVVLFDPHTDVAVLDVPGLGAPALAITPTRSAGAAGVLLGYPLDGPLTISPYRIRTVLRVTGPDVYADATVTRQVAELYAQVRPGNSGGPLVTPAGTVEGLVFAASTTDPTTGYALTAQQIATDVAHGLTASRPVATGACA
jgi:uncharacterized membrane protein required for colicin V production